jgi:putative PIN family toxin of toxin-antitoxin system
MSTGGVKLVLDTNVIVSMIGRRSPNRWIFDKILTREFRLCISNEILFEYEEILAAKTTPEVASNFTDFLISFPGIEQIDIYFKWDLIAEDVDDNKFIDCAVAAQAVIVSEDRHFRPYRTNEHPPLLVLTIEELKAKYQKG